MDRIQNQRKKPITMNLRTLEGIVKLINVETNKPYLTIIMDIQEYADLKQKEHPSRDRISLYREYLCSEIQKNNYKSLRS
jgi:hypothetical protein